MAARALDGISSHEMLCAERWNQTRIAMNEIKRILAWGTCGLIGTMATLISWLATHLGHY